MSQTFSMKKVAPKALVTEISETYIMTLHGPIGDPSEDIAH